MKKILSIALIAALALTSVFAVTFTGDAALNLGYDFDSEDYGFKNVNGTELKFGFELGSGNGESAGEKDLRAEIAGEFKVEFKEDEYTAKDDSLGEPVVSTLKLTKANILYKDLVTVGILDAGESVNYAASYYLDDDDDEPLSDKIEGLKGVDGFTVKAFGVTGGFGFTGNAGKETYSVLAHAALDDKTVAEGLTVAAGAAALLKDDTNTFNANAKVAYAKDLLAASAAVDFQVAGENVLLESAIAASYDFVKFNAYYFTKDKFENNNLDAKLAATKTIDIVTLTGSFEANNIFDQANAFYANREFTPAIEASATVDAFTFGAKASYAIVAKKLATEASVKYSNDFLTAKAALNVNTTIETEDSTQLYVSASVESTALIDGATVSLAYAPYADADDVVTTNLLKADTTKLGKITASCKVTF